MGALLAKNESTKYATNKGILSLNESSDIATTQNLAKSSPKLDLKEVDGAIIDKLANMALENNGSTIAEDGKLNTVTSPIVNENLEKIYSSFTNGIIQPLNTAVQASVSAAQASTSARVPASTSSVAANSEYQPMSRAEIKTDQASLTFDSPTDVPTSKLAPILAQSSQGNQIGSQTLTASTNDSQPGVNLKSTKGTGLSTSNFAGGDTSQTVNTAPSAESDKIVAPAQQRAIASVNPEVTAAAPVDNSTLQKLSVYTEIKGAEYKSIQNQYSDKVFQDQLANRLIRIQTKSLNGSTVYLGATKKYKINLIDTGNGLVRSTK
jgi:hypothetical protein